MFVYSKKIVSFHQEIRGAVRGILSREVGLRVVGDRFYDRERRASYPISIVVYNNKKMLA